MSTLQPGQQFQPSSGFGQQLVAQVNSTGYGQVPGQMQPQPTGYPAQYQNSYQTGYAGQQPPPQMQYSTGYPVQQQQQQYNAGLQSSYGHTRMLHSSIHTVLSGKAGVKPKPKLSHRLRIHLQPTMVILIHVNLYARTRLNLKSGTHTRGSKF